LSLSAALRGAIDICFTSNVLKHFSYRGKTKKKFIDLSLYTIIYGEFRFLFYFLTKWAIERAKYIYFGL